MSKNPVRKPVPLDPNGILPYLLLHHVLPDGDSSGAQLASVPTAKLTASPGRGAFSPAPADKAS